MKKLGLCGLASLAVGLIAGLVICGIALDHNPQGVFRITLTGVIDWPYLLALRGAWAAVTAMVAFVPLALVSLFLGRRSHARRSA